VPLAGKSPNQVFSRTSNALTKDMIEPGSLYQTAIQFNQYLLPGRKWRDDFEPACSQCVNQIAAAIAFERTIEGCYLWAK